MPFGTHPVIAVLPVARTSHAGRRPHVGFAPAVDRTMTSLAFIHFPLGTE